jgi:tetratricopeptide (TPR) repeat protein
MRILLLWSWFLYEQAKIHGQLPSKAREYFEKTTIEARRVHDQYCLIEANIGLGYCAVATGDTNEAMKYLETLKGTLSIGRHPDLQAGIKLGLAAVSHQQGKIEVAEKLYQEVIEFLNQNKMQSMHLIRAWIGLGAIYWHSDRIGKAKEAWQKSFRAAEQISKFKRTLSEIIFNSCRAHSHVPPL